MPTYAAQIGSTLTGLRRSHAADLGNVGLVSSYYFCRPIQPSPLTILGQPSEGRYIAAFEGTLLVENGLYVLPLLLLPILLSSIALLAVYCLKTRLRTVLWVLAGLTMGFCSVLFLSIGMLYIPTAVATVVAATKANEEVI